jgi:hypothetical protein
MIAAKAMHPPAVSTALIFAFEYKEVNVLMMFFLAVLLLVILIVLQRVSLWLIKRGRSLMMGDEDKAALHKTEILK